MLIINKLCLLVSIYYLADANLVLIISLIIILKWGGICGYNNQIKYN